MGKFYLVVAVDHFNLRVILERCPGIVKCVEYLLNEVSIGRRFLADITLAAAVHLQARREFTVSAVKLGFFGVGRQAVNFDFARLANPQDMVVEFVFCAANISANSSIVGWLFRFMCKPLDQLAIYQLVR